MNSIRVGIDSNVFIYVLEKSTEFFKVSLDLLRQVEAGSIDGFASELTMLEVLSDKKLQASQISIVQDFLQSTTVTFLAINSQVLLEAARLRRQDSNLKTPDAIHIASAMLAGATYFITNDQKLYNKKIKDIELVSLAKAESLIR